MVLEYLLLAERVRTQIIHPKFDDRMFHSLPDVDEATPGNVQGLNPWIVECRLETAVLSMKEVQEDAHAIFEKNNWVHITVNVGDFSAQLRKTGFEVLTSRRAQAIKSHSFEMKISFDVTTRGEDKFFWPSIELSTLFHALSLTTYYDKAKVQLTFCARPGDEVRTISFAQHEAREWELIGPFAEALVKPRSVEIIGSRSVKVANFLRDFDGTIQKSDVVVVKIANDKLDESTTALQAECWQEAYEKAVSCIGLIDITLKCDVEGQRYANVVPQLESMLAQCMSNITLARLRLGDAEGAVRKSHQIIVDALPPDCKFDGILRQAMAAAAIDDLSIALWYFDAASKLSPSHPQLREELEAFKGRLSRKIEAMQNITPESLYYLATLRGSIDILDSHLDR
ncbi:MAG: hypothetical protein LQ347_005334 [Umbilicaria vellea]|nr:MAG: hypothetical protein LQ347_005334 [Umbilicaria vellea]